MLQREKPPAAGDRRTAEPLRGGVGLVAESWVSEGGSGGWDWRGRRESVPGGLAAPSIEGCANPWEWVSQQDWQQLQAGTSIGGNPAGP
ncbi:hypothetical protein B9Y56_17295, partial [Stenotrophomonas maltophilia]